MGGVSQAVARCSTAITPQSRIPNPQSPIPLPLPLICVFHVHLRLNPSPSHRPGSAPLRPSAPPRFAPPRILFLCVPQRPLRLRGKLFGSPVSAFQFSVFQLLPFVPISWDTRFVAPRGQKSAKTRVLAARVSSKTPLENPAASLLIPPFRLRKLTFATPESTRNLLTMNNLKSSPRQPGHPPDSPGAAGSRQAIFKIFSRPAKFSCRPAH